MANDDLDLELKKDSRGSKQPLILIIIIAVLVGIIAIILTIMLVGGGDKPSNNIAAAESIKEKSDELKQEAIYFDVRPPFVVNFHTKGRLRYLQVHVELMTRSQDVVENIKLHLPLIKNNLVTLFSSQQFDSIQTYEGKEKLRESALEEVQRVMIGQTGEPGVEAVLFTSFVVQ